MSNIQSNDILFVDYYAQWVRVYKEGAVRPITLHQCKYIRLENIQIFFKIYIFRQRSC